jgi:alpha-galactosidase
MSAFPACWRTAAIAIAVTSSAAAGAELPAVPLDSGWRFMPGDNLEYAKTGFDDSAWQKIAVDRIWEEQGHEKLDGYAWYRARVVIPSSLRDKAYLKDGLRIFLGKINNFDQSFLNGQIFGVNGAVVAATTAADDAFTKADMSLWDVARTYVLLPDDPRIHWDAENVVAVRVFDQGGEGGLWSGGPSIRMLALADFLANDCGTRTFAHDAQGLAKTCTLTNTSDLHPLAGRLAVTGRNKLSGESVLQRVEALDLAPGASAPLALQLPPGDQSTLITCEVTFSASGESTSWREETPYILTPRPPEAPRINGPAVVGARPGHPFLFTVPASGRRPMQFAAAGLPPGLAIGQTTGIVTGVATRRGRFPVTFTAVNELGRDTRSVSIEIGDRIALTPPMGWNSWNAWGLAVDEQKVLAAASAFKEKGLADHGWAYVNIDDGWEIKGDAAAPKRTEHGAIITNEKFPDMKRVGDGLHALGLRLGIYSSPGPLTCGGYTASFEHEREDARSYAAWGVDYLKYDWCSYEKIAKGSSRKELERPYALMRKMLDEVDRDIVYSLCQYGMGDVWKWGDSVGGNLWRTTGDITDTWKSMSEIGFAQVKNARYARPGNWNDPDMLVVGWVGWGPSLHPTRLTPDEQYTHISLWSLLSAPLLIGCDLERLDEFTLNLLTNDEVLAVDQDPLGRPAAPVLRRASWQIWLKQLAGGSRAMGVFNTGDATLALDVPLHDLGLTGAWSARDLWRQKDLGVVTGTARVEVPSHGVVLLKLARE